MRGTSLISITGQDTVKVILFQGLVLSDEVSRLRTMWDNGSNYFKFVHPLSIIVRDVETVVPDRTL